MLICEYFGVNKSELDYLHSKFLQTYDAAKPSAEPSNTQLFTFAANFGAPPPAIKRYAGDYLIYHTSRTLRNATFV